MTKQILAFLFCFIRELTLYSPLTLSLTSARELKPYTPPFKDCVFIKPLVFLLNPPPTYPPIPSTNPFKICLFRPILPSG